MHRLRGPAPGDTRCARLDAMVVLYHRPSGATHLLAQPLPELLEALEQGDATMADLLARLDIEPGAAATEALAARLGELEALGLVERLG